MILCAAKFLWCINKLYSAVCQHTSIPSNFGKHGNAVGLSCLPLSEVESDDNDAESKVFNVSQMEVLPVTVHTLKIATRSDRIQDHLCNLAAASGGIPFLGPSIAVSGLWSVIMVNGVYKGIS